MAEQVEQVRSFLLPLEPGNVLLPATTVMEVIGFTDPEPAEDTPDWVLGTVGWRGTRIPVLSVEILTGNEAPQTSIRDRIVVLYGLTDIEGLPYVAIATRGIPRVVLASNENVQYTDGADEAGLIHMRVKLDDAAAVIPNLDGIESALRDAASEWARPQ